MQPAKLRWVVMVVAVAAAAGTGWWIWGRSTVGYGTCRIIVSREKTDAQKAQGLAGRRSLGKNQAMLFNFGSEIPTFWMKGMRFPIDIAWIAKDVIVGIEANVPPDNGAKTYPAPKPVDWVLETSANRFAECGVKVGDTITGL